MTDATSATVDTKKRQQKRCAGSLFADMGGNTIFQVIGMEASLSMKDSAIEDNTLLDSRGLRGSAVQAYSTYNLGSLVRMESLTLRRNTGQNPLLQQVVERVHGASGQVNSTFYSYTQHTVAVSFALIPGNSIEPGENIQTLPLAAAAQLPMGSFLSLEDEGLKALQEVCLLL